MDFRVLGPLEVLGDDGRVSLAGPKQRAVLAHLILRPNRVVPASLLIDELWGDEPPETARNTLQTYVYRLRKVPARPGSRLDPAATSCTPSRRRSTRRASRRWSGRRSLDRHGSDEGVVYQLDQGSRLVATRPTGPGATMGSFDEGVVRVGNSDVGTVSGVDAVSGARRTFRFEHPVQGVAAGAGMLMVTLGPGPTYEDVIDGLHWTVARFFAPAGFLAAPDPATLFEDIGFWWSSPPAPSS